MSKNPLWLPGWGMFPSIGPTHDFTGRPLHALAPWPGYALPEENSEKIWTLDALLAWLDAQVDRYGEGEAVEITGWSMGGMLALCYADHFPHKIKQLTLWASTAHFEEAPEWPGRTSAEVENLRHALHREDARAMERFIKSQIPAAPAFREARRYLSEYYRQAPQPHWQALRESLEWLVNIDIRPRLPYIEVPVAVYHGSEDAIIPFEAGRQLARMLPYATWHPHIGCGHALWLTPA